MNGFLIHSHLRTLVALLVALLVTACASPARVDQMQVSVPIAARSSIASSAMKETVAIKDVTGGKETNPAWISNISSADFERALENSLKDAGLLALNRQGSRYQLTAHLQKLDQPFVGASMTVTATVQYTLVERASGKNVLVETVSLPYTAEFSAAFLGSERLRLANEGAARVNIQRLVELLAAYKPS